MEEEKSKDDKNDEKEEELSLMEPDEPPGTSNIIFAGKVFIGSGIEAGAWAGALVEKGAGEGALIISDQPQGTAPYNRYCLTNNLIDPTLEASRSFNNLPFCTLQQGETSEALPLAGSIDKEEVKDQEGVDESRIQNLAWYAANGIKVLSGLMMMEADLDKKKLVFTEMKMSQDESKYADPMEVTVHFEQLCVGTGLEPILIPGPGPKFGWTVDCMLSPVISEFENQGQNYGESDTGSMMSMDERSITESEVSAQPESVVSVAPVGKLEVSAPEEYGFGSVHYLSDMGDGTKLIHALSRAEEDGQEPVFDPVVIVGGGPAALEVCSTLSNHFPDLSLVLVLPSQGVLPSIFQTSAGSSSEESSNEPGVPQSNSGDGKDPGPCEELRAFYESQLVKRGIKIARGFLVSRLWLPSEEGSFSTLDGPPSNLRPTRPRSFRPSPSQFKQSKGVVLTPNTKVTLPDSPTGYIAEEVYLAARLVIVCGEQRPNVPPPLIAAGLKTVPTTDSESCDVRDVVVMPNVASSAFTDNALVVDHNCCTNHPDVYACGGCAAFTIQPAKHNASGTNSRPTSRGNSSRPNSRPGTSQSRRMRGSKVLEPVLTSHLTSMENVTAMATFAANVMVEGIPSQDIPRKLSRRLSGPSVVLNNDSVDEDSNGFFPYDTPGKFNPVPWLTCCMSELSFRFAGSTLEATPVLVGSTIGYPKFFSCIWVKDNRIVGVFLEGGEAKHSRALMTMASQRPRIINIKKLKRVPLEALLADPFCLEPPVMSFKGEFLAELDDDAVFDALRVFDVDGGGVVKTSSLGSIMAELGSDWDEDELAEAEAAMDPSGKGLVSYETFRTWWGN